MDSIANGYGCRPCKIKQVQLDVTDAILHFIGDGSALSHLNASNVDFGTLSTTVFPVSGVSAGTYGSSSNISQVTVDQYGRVTAAANIAAVSSQWTGPAGSSIYYIPGVSIGSSNDATANLQVTGNVYVSNAVTTANVYVTDTLDVTGSMTANAANATFFFDTFTIPYINTQVLNVSSSTTLTGNLVAETANIATLNVGYLTVNSAVVYGATTLNVYGVSNLTDVFATTANVGTLNVWQVSNLSTLTLTNNLDASNAVTTTNVFANTSTLTGTTGQTTLDVTGNLYVSNAVTTTNLYTAGITSNAVSTVFNFDTLTIPFVSSTTLNVASTSNLDTVTLTGEPGLTTVFASGNIYVSNAVTTTNVFATRLNVSTVSLFATPTVAPTIASATTIAPTAPITFISGTSNIVTITPPIPISTTGGSLTFIPTGAFVSNTAGNIALGTTAVVSRALIMTWDATTVKWYPSY